MGNQPGRYPRAMTHDFVGATIDDLVAWAASSDSRTVDHDEARLLLELLRDHLGVTGPADLGVGEIEALLLEVYPRKVTGVGSGDAPEVIATLRTLLAFFGETRRIGAGAVKRLARAVDRVEPKFPGAPDDFELFGPDDSPDDIEVVFDGDFADIKEDLDLPDRLPPLRLPPEDELAATARASGLLHRARRLAVWVGDRRKVDEFELSAADTIAAARVLGIQIPESVSAAEPLPDMPTPVKVRRMSDLPELMQLWELAEELEFVEFDELFAATGPGVDVWPNGNDEDVLDVWQHALADALSRTLVLAADLSPRHTLDFYGVGGLATLLLFLARDEGVSPAVLDQMMQESSTAGMLPIKARKEWQSWVRAHGSPADALLMCLAELGAVEVDEDVARLTPLGLYAIRLQFVDNGVEVPLLPSPEKMSAADLVVVGMTASQEDFVAESTVWLGLRSPDSAAEEVLNVASAGDPSERAVAVSIVGQLGVSAREHWQQALDNPPLRPYAKIALGQLAGADPADPASLPPELVPTPTDVAWLLTDMLAGMVDWAEPDELAQSLDEAVPPGEEQIFEQIWRLDHPCAHEVLLLIGNNHPDKKVAKAARKAAFKVKAPE